MARLIPSTFSMYELTPEEERDGSLLTVSQKMVLQNKLAQLATSKMQLVFTPNDINTYQQQEAELQGQLGIIQWLLETSEVVESDLRVAVEESVAANSRPPVI